MRYKKPEGKHSGSESLRCGDKNTHIPMSRSMKYQKRNHIHFLRSKGLGLGVMNKRCVYLQLHDLCTGTASLVSWACREHRSLSHAWAVVAQSRTDHGEWLLKKKNYTFCFWNQKVIGQKQVQIIGVFWLLWVISFNKWTPITGLWALFLV